MAGLLVDRVTQDCVCFRVSRVSFPWLPAMKHGDRPRRCCWLGMFGSGAWEAQWEKGRGQALRPPQASQDEAEVRRVW